MLRNTFRTAVPILGVLVLAAPSTPIAAAKPPVSTPAPEVPILGTPEQDAAENLVLELLQHPDIKAIQASLRDQLRQSDIGRTRDGAATADRAVDCMTTSMLFHVVSEYQPKPYFVWGTEDSGRDWRGRSVPCIGTAGDNPDNIYRGTTLEGGVRYEITGKLADPKHRATQFIVQMGKGEGSIAPNMATAGSEVVQVLGAFDDQHMQIAPDGSFRMTVGGESGAPVHVATPPGPIGIGFRDTMADWNQEPAQLAVRRLDPGEAPVVSKDEIRRIAVGRLGDYVRNWSQYATYGFGGLKPNTHSLPNGRAGGWGFVMGIRYQLADDEVAVVTTSRGQAKYTGFQVVDPWTIASDARKYQTSLNNTQAVPDKDGNTTYVISPVDPGVANWLDTTGLHDGFAILRWQAIPPGMTNEGLFRGFRVMKLADVAKLQGVARVTPAQRQAQLAKRAVDWAHRLR